MGGVTGAARLAWLGLFAGSLCWAGNALVARAVHGQIPPLGLAFWRWCLALACLLPFIAVPLWRQRAAIRHAGWRLLVLSGLSISAYNSLLYSAAQNTEAINITLVSTCLPLATFIGAGLLLGEWPSRRAWLGLAIAALGLLWLIARGEPANLTQLNFNPGDLLMLLAVLDWALYSLLLRRWAAWIDLPPLSLLGMTMLLGVPLLLPFYLFEHSQVGGFSLDLTALAAIGYTALFASLFAYFAWNHGVRVLGASRAALSSYSMPVFTALLGWLLLGEQLQSFHWLGATLIFAGLLLATRTPAR